MARKSKYERKVEEAIFRFFVVPVIFIIGLLVVSDIISQQIGGEIFKWFLFGGGLLVGLAIYFRKQLQEIKW